MKARGKKIVDFRSFLGLIEKKGFLSLAEFYIKTNFLIKGFELNAVSRTT
jgi:hypothetical protein